MAARDQLRSCSPTHRIGTATTPQDQNGFIIYDNLKGKKRPWVKQEEGAESSRPGPRAFQDTSPDCSWQQPDNLVGDC